MVRFYVLRVSSGKTTLERVPTLWRDDVAAALKEADDEL